MNRLDIIKSAYDILENITPLKLDCGVFCNKACCQDNDASDDDSGMLLFPGEEELFSDCHDWMTMVSAAQIHPGLHFAKCRGTCPRNRRPLACRIFPLTPYLTENEILLVKMDPRALHLCPLARERSANELLPEFKKAVRKASAVLIAEPSIKEYICRLSRMLDDYTSLPWYQLISRPNNK